LTLWIAACAAAFTVHSCSCWDAWTTRSSGMLPRLARGVHCLTGRAQLAKLDGCLGGHHCCRDEPLRLRLPLVGGLGLICTLSWVRREALAQWPLTADRNLSSFTSQRRPGPASERCSQSASVPRMLVPPSGSNPSMRKLPSTWAPLPSSADTLVGPT